MLHVHRIYQCRSGVLQPGDRILAINGQQLEGMTLEDARSIIKDSNNQIHVEIEFDVAGK
jgi:C-terminal processing protease CtpA/Prc